MPSTGFDELFESLLSAGQEKFGSVGKLAEAAGMTRGALYQARNGSGKGVGFTGVHALARAAGLGDEERTRLLYAWLVSRAKRTGEGRSLLKLVERMRKDLKKSDQDEELMTILVSAYLEEVAAGAVDKRRP